jgi:TrmH family RNA methyltransferase
MLVEGIRLAREALSEAVAIREALVSPRLDLHPQGQDIIAGLTRARVPLHSCDDRLLSSLHHAETHQGVLLLVERPDLSDAHLTAGAGPRPLVLAAFGVQDPGNLGALIRLADAAGASSLLAAGGADPFGPKAVRGSAGSIFRLPVVRARTASQGVGILDDLRSKGVTIAGAMPRGGTDYRSADMSGPMALVLGGEGAGMPPEVEARLDRRLTIPMNPRVESINVAAAAAVLLFAAAGSGRDRLTIPPARRPPGSSQSPGSAGPPPPLADPPRRGRRR